MVYPADGVIIRFPIDIVSFPVPVYDCVEEGSIKLIVAV